MSSFLATLTNLVARRDTLVTEKDSLDAQIDFLASEVEDMALDAAPEDISDEALALLFAETWGVHAVSDQLRRRMPLASGFNRVRGAAKYDVINPVFPQSVIQTDPTAVAEAIVDAKQRFGRPEAVMMINISDPSQSPDQYDRVWIRSDFTIAQTKDILVASVPPAEQA